MLELASIQAILAPNCGGPYVPGRIALQEKKGATLMISRRIRALPWRHCTLAGILAVLAPPSMAQGIGELPKFDLTQGSIVDIPSLPSESIAAPLFCDADGGVLFRLATPEAGVEDPVAVSRDGKVVVRFGKEKVNDISQPALGRMFIAGDDVYILATGREALGYQLKLRTPSGETQSVPASKAPWFIAHFKRDGGYVGAVHLDLRFTPQQIGVFEDGDFLVAGMDRSQGVTRAALVGSNGQLRRLLELEGDVHAQTEDSASKGRDPMALPRVTSPGDGQGSFLDVVSNSQVVQSGPDLVLFRRSSGPVFVVSSAGEVRVQRLKLKGKYTLFAIKPAPSVWIVESMHDLPGNVAQEFSTYAFDPKSGEPLREYIFDADLGWGLACTDGNEFTFVIASEKTNTLRLVTMKPALSK